MLHTFIRHWLMRVLLLLILVFSSISTYSNEENVQTFDTPSKVVDLSDAELLQKAETLKLIDKKMAVQLATEVLHRAERNNQHTVSAQAHALLGAIARQNKNLDLSLFHLSQSVLIYGNINDISNQITSAINYIELLIAEKRYRVADETINELLPLAKQHSDDFLIAELLIKKGYSYYQQKHYQDAVVYYTQATKYLSNKTTKVQHSLGETYKVIAQSYKRLKNREQTAHFYKKTLNVFTELQNKKLMARTLNTIAEAERYLGNLVTSLDYSMQGLTLHKELDDPTGYAKALLGAGIIYRHIGRYEKSLTHIHQAHLYYKKVKDLLGIAKTSNQIGLLYTRLKQYDEAKSFYQLTLNLPEGKIGDKTVASALRELAVINLDSGQYEAAMEMAQKAYEIYKRNNLTENQSTTARIIGNIYRDQKENSKAVTYYKESLSLAVSANSNIHQIKALNPLAHALTEVDINEAIRLLKESLRLSNIVGDKHQMLYSYRHFRAAEKFRGNFLSALNYAEKELLLLEVIQKENEDNQLTLVKANLHSHKMELELESLREKARLDALVLARKNNEIEISTQAKMITELQLIKNKYASIALTLLLITCVLIIAFIYRRFIASSKLNKKLGYLASRDPLTECYNRRVLFKLMKQNFADIELLDEYCIILADIDHFKDVNNNHGHNMGDVVLKGVVETLQSCVRQNDIVARFGGEEFCIVLHKVNQKQAMVIAEKMRSKIAQTSFDGVSVTSSFGVTSIRFGAKDPAELIDQADTALYKSKAHGRNQVTLWDQAL